MKYGEQFGVSTKLPRRALGMDSLSQQLVPPSLPGSCHSSPGTKSYREQDVLVEGKI